MHERECIFENCAETGEPLVDEIAEALGQSYHPFFVCEFCLQRVERVVRQTLLAHTKHAMN